MTQNHPTLPNILWISLEDTTPRFGCYGDSLARTPNIDDLAATGCRFPNAFSTAGVCAPSRASIITGMYATSIGAHHMRTSGYQSSSETPMPYETVPPHYAKCFPEYLRAAGYYCTNNFKTDYQFAPPFTAWDECGKEAHWHHRPDAAQPFFAVFNPVMTHESRMWPSDNETITTDPDAVVMPPYLPDTPVARQTLARQYDNIAAADRRVGELLAELVDAGLAENTIVFLWSDHGEGLPRGKRWPYDRGIRIPLLVRWPGTLEPGGVNESLVSLIDLAPTVLQLAGVEAPRHFQGQSFLGPNATPREYIYAGRDRHGESYDMVRAVRDRRFKYIRNFCPELSYLPWIDYLNRHPVMQEMWRLYAQGELEGTQNAMFQPRPTEELYDIESDPWEINNLAGEAIHATELRRMRAALDDWRAKVGDKGELSEAEMVAQWWPSGVQPQTAAPIFVPIDSQNPGLEAAPEGGTFAAPLLVQLHCPTQGASLGYTFESEEISLWQLYTQPLRLPPGRTTLRAKAIRIGYVESPETVADFIVEQQP